MTQFPSKLFDAAQRVLDSKVTINPEDVEHSWEDSGVLYTGNRVDVLAPNGVIELQLTDINLRISEVLARSGAVTPDSLPQGLSIQGSALYSGKYRFTLAAKLDRHGGQYFNGTLGLYEASLKVLGSELDETQPRSAWRSVRAFLDRLSA